MQGWAATGCIVLAAILIGLAQLALRARGEADRAAVAHELVDRYQAQAAATDGQLRECLDRLSTLGRLSAFGQLSERRAHE
jgi:hypothetical protein